MWQQALKAYVLFGFEPEFDTADPAQAQHALQDASFVVVMNSYMTETMLSYADVILPLASFAETSGTFIGIDKQWQSFTGAVKPKGESRPGWKILRVLANLAKIPAIDFVSSQDVRDEVQDKLNLYPVTKSRRYVPADLNVDTALMAISEVPMYQIDAMVRRSEALQQTPDNLKSQLVRMNSEEAARYGLVGQNTVTVSQNDKTVTLPFELDETIADGCIYMATGLNDAAQLGASYSLVSINSEQAVVVN